MRKKNKNNFEYSTKFEDIFWMKSYKNELPPNMSKIELVFILSDYKIRMFCVFLFLFTSWNYLCEKSKCVWDKIYDFEDSYIEGFVV